MLIPVSQASRAIVVQRHFRGLLHMCICVESWMPELSPQAINFDTGKCKRALMLALHILWRPRILDFILFYLLWQECWIQLYLCMVADAAGSADVFSRGKCIYTGVSFLGQWATS